MSFRPRRPLPGARVLLLALAAAVMPSGCRDDATQPGLVIFAIEIRPGVRPFDKLVLAAQLAGASAHELDAAAVTKDAFNFGYYLPATRGTFRVEAQAFRRTSLVGTGAVTVRVVTAGQRRDASEALVIAPPDDPKVVPPVDAGGDAGGGDLVTIGQAPVLVESVPAEGQLEVSRTSPLALAFDRPLDPASIEAETVVVKAGDRRIAGAVYLNASLMSVIFTPHAPMPRLTRVTVTVATGLRAAAGTPLAAPVQLTFTTGDGSWSPPEVIATHDNRELTHVWLDLAIDASGNGFALWEKRVSGTNAANDLVTLLQAYHYTADAGWKPNALLAPAQLKATHAPALAIDDAGRALFINPATETVLGPPGMPARMERVLNHAHFDPVLGWTTGTRLERPLVGVTYADLSMSRTGSGFATWGWTADRATNDHRVVALRFVGVDWGKQQQFISQPPQRQPPTQSNSQTASAIDPKGNAAVVWVHEAGVDLSQLTAEIWANRFDPITGWGAAVRIAPAGTGMVWGPRIVMDDAGNALAAWAQSAPDGNSNLVHWSAFSVAAAKWSAPVFAGMSLGSSPELSINGAGEALLSFSNFRDAFIVRIVNGAAVEKTQIEGYASAVSTGLDAEGNQLHLWVDPYLANLTDPVPIYVARRAAGGPALPRMKLGNDAAAVPVLRVLPDGRAVALWVEGKNPQRLMTARFD